MSVACHGASLVAQMVKILPAVQEDQVRKIPGRREWLPTPFLPAEFHGLRSLEGYRPWDCKELDTTEPLTLFTWLAIFVRLGYYFHHLPEKRKTSRTFFSVIGHIRL